MGLREVFVDAHAEDLEALAFYRATGGRGESVFQFSYPLHP